MISIVNDSIELLTDFNDEGDQNFPIAKAISHTRTKNLLNLHKLSKDSYEYENDTTSF